MVTNRTVKENYQLHLLESYRAIKLFIVNQNNER
jgi:hypothetical protein